MKKLQGLAALLGLALALAGCGKDDPKPAEGAPGSTAAGAAAGGQPALPAAAPIPELKAPPR
ncbi:MAG: hypothetical protein R3F60_30285 [bacterium]